MFGRKKEKVEETMIKYPSGIGRHIYEMECLKCGNRFEDTFTTVTETTTLSTYLIIQECIKRRIDPNLCHCSYCEMSTVQFLISYNIIP